MRGPAVNFNTTVEAASESDAYLLAELRARHEGWRVLIRDEAIDTGPVQRGHAMHLWWVRLRVTAR